MQNTYYIFTGIVALISLAIGGVLANIFFCSVSDEVGISLKDFSEEEEKPHREKGECSFFVDVSGAVMEPGVVCLDSGAIVNDAIEKAQGFNPAAYAFKYVAQRVNLARILENEEKIYIPFRDDVVCTRVEDDQVNYTASVMREIRMPKSVVTEVQVDSKELDETEEKIVSDDCISINNASNEELMGLTGIGEARARDIIDGRPYSKLEDIKNVSGIGDATYENIKDFICL